MLINPQLELSGELVETDEGCLSVPGFYEPVTRRAHTSVKALDRQGKPFSMQADGLLSVCIQHECDHLEGKLFVDYLSNLKRMRIQKKLSEVATRRRLSPATTTGISAIALAAASVAPCGKSNVGSGRLARGETPLGPWRNIGVTHMTSR